ncbi:MAG: TIGR00341 family protein [Oligoflexus sp.]
MSKETGETLGEQEKQDHAIQAMVLVFDPEETEVLNNHVRPKFSHYFQEEIPFSAGLDMRFPPGTTIVTWLNDKQIAALIPFVVKYGWQLGILPHPKRSLAFLNYGISSDLDEASDDILNGKIGGTAIDIMYCNGIPVLNSVIIGETLVAASAVPKQESVWQRLLRLFRMLKRLKSLSYFPIKLKTQKEKTLETAAIGLITIEHGRSSVLSKRYIHDSFLNDGVLHTLVIAPRSLMEMLHFLLTSFFFPGAGDEKLPAHVGHFKTAKLSITSKKPIEFSLDQTIICAQQLDFEVVPKSMRLITGRHLKKDHSQTEEKEVFRIQSLPTGEAVDALSYKSIPLINHAAVDEFKELFSHLRENSQVSESYVVLMVLSTLLACFGLFANSSPVIIGAMILAPLMSPIISLSMGVLRQNQRLVSDSSKTLLFGVSLALGFAMILTWVTPLRIINDEISARLSPTLLDLGIAVISGIAGAYAHARAEIAKSLAGVAIAVALVPPLAVAGIGMGWAEWSVFFGAFLLFLTNLSGIVLAAALTFLFLGFSPFHLAQRGLLSSLILVGIVSIPLGFGFKTMVDEHRLIRSLHGQEFEGISLREVVVRRHQPLELGVRLMSITTIDGVKIDQVKKAIESQLGQEVTLEVTVSIVR